MGVPFPGGESLKGFVAHHLDHGDFSLGDWPAQLSANKGIIKARVRGILRRACEEDARRTRPIDCSETHRAGLASRVQVAGGQLELAQGSPLSADAATSALATPTLP